MYIYVLQLQSNKYYIGKSHNKKTLYKRITCHYEKHKNAAVWTKKYKPVKIIDIIEFNEKDKFIEDNIVLEYMSKYGIENVRGGSFCRIDLTDEEIKVIMKFIQTEEDRCFTCNSKKHMSNNCPENKKKKKKKKKKNKLIIEDIRDKDIQVKQSCCKRFINYFNIFSLIH